VAFATTVNTADDVVSGAAAAFGHSIGQGIKAQDRQELPPKQTRRREYVAFLFLNKN
jgi:hypothetical protein